MEAAFGNQPSDIAQLSFEQALKELENLVRKLESGESGLEQSITEYERGTALKEHCLKKLHEARLKVERIVQKQTGLTTEPFDGE